MLIIFAVAALALLAVVGIFVILPIMIVVSVVRSRRPIPDEAIEKGTHPDSDFIDLISSQWPQEASHLRPGLPQG
jgi:hypothetical protein